MKPPKPIKALKNAHTPNTKQGMGSYSGSGLRNKIGRMREDSVGMIPATKKKLKTPPKSLA